MPVISSVTACSTCRRVFISRNTKPSCGGVEHFYRADHVVADARQQARQQQPHVCQLRLGNTHGAGFLEHFLVAALPSSRARTGCAPRRGGRPALQFDVARRLDRALQVQLGRAEELGGNAAGRSPGCCQLLRIARGQHADAATAASGLNKHRITDARGRSQRLVAARQHRRAGAWGMPCPAMKARTRLVAQRARIQRSDGPMKHRPCCCGLSKPAFSDRKP